MSRLLTDPESERLLADNMSGSGMSDNGTVLVCLFLPLCPLCPFSIVIL